MSPWQSLFLPHPGADPGPRQGPLRGPGAATLPIPLVCKVQGVKCLPCRNILCLPLGFSYFSSSSSEFPGRCCWELPRVLHPWALMLQFPCSLCSPDSIKLLPNLFFFLFIFSSLLKISCSCLHRHRKYRITDCSLKRYFFIYIIYTKFVNIFNLFPYTVHFILHCTEVGDNCNSWKRLLGQRYLQRN